MAILLGLATAGTAAAQVASTSGADSLLPEVGLRNTGWSQLANYREILDFILELVEVAVLTAVIAFHPVTLEGRRSKADYDHPRTLFLYALIGMTVGFLVMTHGYIIGFVMFGIGGLLRFRSDTGAPAATTRLILATIVGLCVGLDLPVIALVAVIGGGLVVHFLSLSEKLQLDVKFKGKKNVQESIDHLSLALAQRGYRTLSVCKVRFAPTAEFVVEAEHGKHRSNLMRDMMELQADKEMGVEDWHLG